MEAGGLSAARITSRADFLQEICIYSLFKSLAHKVSGGVLKLGWGMGDVCIYLKSICSLWFCLLPSISAQANIQ